MKPEHTQILRNWYCCLRVSKRNEALRRFYYRKIEKEKLRIAELGSCQRCIKRYCRYLSNLAVGDEYHPCDWCMSNIRQMQLDFT